MMQRIKGLAALLLILAILAGTPALLVAMGSNPLQVSSWPTLQQLTRLFTAPDDGSMLLGLLKLVAWLAWLVLAIMLVIEIIAALRGVRAPTMPGLRAPQGMLRGLVATAALVFVTAPLAGGIATAAPTPAPASAPAPQQITAPQHVTAPTERQKPAKAAKTITVKKGDTLWDIAEDKLGDGARYPEIYKASKKTTQPDGRHLTDPDEIDIGWKLTIPGQVKRDAGKHREPTVTVTPQTPPAPIPTTSAPATSAPTASAPASSVPTSAPSDATTADPADQSAWMVQTAAGVGTLLAAGVVALVRRRRRTQQQRRRPGTAMPLPDGTAAATEQQLRAAADPLSVDSIDQALRALAAHCRAARQPLPDVRAARLTADAFDLYLTEPAELPSPWSDQLDQTVWTITVDDSIPAIASDAIPAPYPALVTLGADDDQGHVLINLENIAGLSLTGDPDDTRAVLAALAVELATSTWADDLTVTVVAAFAELDALGTGRIRYAPSISTVLDELEARAAADREALGDSTLNSARVTDTAADSWMPEIVIIGSELTAAQAVRLAGIVDQLPRVAVAAVSATSTVGEWTLTINAGGPATLEPIGLELIPQRLPADLYSDVLELTTLSDVDELDTAAASEPEPTVADVDATAPATDDQPAEPASAMPPVTDTDDPNRPLPAALRAVLTSLDPNPDLIADDDTPFAVDEADAEDSTADASPIAPRINVLGPVTIDNATGDVEQSRKGRLLELATYLVLNPGATHSQIDDAIWPNRGPGDNFSTRNPATTKLRRWLGTSPDGQDYVPRHQSTYSLHQSVTSDVAIWDRLVAGNAAQAATEALEEAFQLIRGIPFEGVDFRRRYAWAEPLQQRLIGDIVDVAHELGRRRLLAGRWRAAEEAIVVGLRIEPAQESLWRMRILAAHESGNRAAVTEAIDRLLAIMDKLECELEAETVDLLNELQGRSYRKAL